jgi:hypothetical protein
MTDQPLASAGIYEFVFGVSFEQTDALADFFAVLGFEPVAKGSLAAADAERLYGHGAELRSVRLAHPGCARFGTGHVRLQSWSELRNDGLASAHPLDTGSRWMGIYTHDVLQLRDGLSSARTRETWNLRLSPLVAAPLERPAPAIHFDQPFVGLREQLAFGDAFRLAFIQRGGFDRPGFGTFDDALPYKNTEGSHANIVQPVNSFSTAFYKEVFDLETAPFGEAHDSGTEAPTIAALNLAPAQTFRVERIRASDCPTGLLQVYSPYSDSADCRDLSRPGSRNLSHYTFRVRDIHECAARVRAAGGTGLTEVQHDEFGMPCIVFDAPDGIAWSVCADAG